MIKYAYRMTHILNVPHILREGLVHPNSERADQRYVSIGDQSLINVRSGKTVDGHLLSEYIPFYFGYRTPMLYVIQNGFNGVTKRKPEEVVYCVVRLEDVEQSQLNFIFTDGHANNAISKFYPKERMADIDSILNPNDIFADHWKDISDIDLKRRKEAELLFYDEVPPSMIIGFVVYDEAAKAQLMNYGVEEKKIAIRNSYYY